MFCIVKYCLFCLLTKKIRMAKEVSKGVESNLTFLDTIPFQMSNTFKVLRYFTDVFRENTRGHFVFGGISRMLEMGLYVVWNSHWNPSFGSHIIIHMNKMPDLGR